jgi:NADP-dependent 3-hydroxy acid dehydrogenase YdfG
VTGASSAIGAATARRLARDGFLVYCAARREELLRELAAEIDGVAVPCDVTDDGSVQALAATIGGQLRVLVNNAGSAIEADGPAASDPDHWRRMYELNVLGTLRVCQAMLPALEGSGDGLLVNVGSTAGHEDYVNGGGYIASKRALSSLTRTLREELLGSHVRVTEIAPGMVTAEKLSVVRDGRGQQAADGVHAGVLAALTVEDLAECIAWIVGRPSSVNIDLMVLRAHAQASHHPVDRDD